jgi:hypothetical protein
MAGRLRNAAGLAVTLVLTALSLAGEPAPEKAANAKARAEAARKVYECMMERYRLDAGFKFDPEQAYQWSRRWMEAEREAAGAKAGRVAAVEGHLERMKKWEKVMETDNAPGRHLYSPGDYAAAQFYRLEAEGWLAQEKAREGGRP